MSREYTVINGIEGIMQNGIEIKAENMFDGRKNTYWESYISKGSGVNVTFEVPKKLVAIEIDTRLDCCNDRKGK